MINVKIKRCSSLSLVILTGSTSGIGTSPATSYTSLHNEILRQKKQVIVIVSEFLLNIFDLYTILDFIFYGWNFYNESL